MAPVEDLAPEWCLVGSDGQTPISCTVKSVDTGEDLGSATLTLNQGGTFRLDLPDSKSFWGLISSFEAKKDAPGTMLCMSDQFHSLELQSLGDTFLPLLERQVRKWMDELSSWQLRCSGPSLKLSWP